MKAGKDPCVVFILGCALKTKSFFFFFFFFYIGLLMFLLHICVVFRGFMIFVNLYK